MPISENPEQTRGRESTATQSLSFPIHERPAYMTQLRFTKYSRFEPSDQPSEQTTAMVSLPLPLNISDNSSIRTTTLDLNGFGTDYGQGAINAANQSATEGTFRGILDALGAGISVANEEIKMMGQNFKVSALRGLALAPLTPDSIKPTAGMYAGVVRNPHTNLVFEGVNPKTFALSWRLSARSQQESDALNSIVALIKERIHPEETIARYALDYPDLVNVEYTGDAASYLPNIRRAMISSFQVTPGAGGNGLSFYKSGAPVEYQIDIMMSELNIVTRNVLRGDRE